MPIQTIEEYCVICDNKTTWMASQIVGQQTSTTFRDFTKENETKDGYDKKMEKGLKYTAEIMFICQSCLKNKLTKQIEVKKIAETKLTKMKYEETAKIDN
ncbi:MAG: hypothetical protein ACOZBH_04485 [Patescibacteria group bacterium]